jgi:thiaminase/transcriptional activator TenA
LLKKAIESRATEQVWQDTMSFFERLKAAASAEWRAYTEHPFTNGMADGSLAEAAFRHYLVQDYLFLIEFARAYALSVYKAPKLADMREAAAGLSAHQGERVLKLDAGTNPGPGRRDVRVLQPRN